MERVFEHENGLRVTTINEIQANVYANEVGFKEVTDESAKKK
jgi:hypothetical protein